MDVISEENELMYTSRALEQRPLMQSKYYWIHQLYLSNYIISVKNIDNPWWSYIVSQSDYDSTLRIDLEFFFYIHQRCKNYPVNSSSFQMKKNIDYFLCFEDAVRNIISNAYALKKSAIIIAPKPTEKAKTSSNSLVKWKVTKLKTFGVNRITHDAWKQSRVGTSSNEYLVHNSSVENKKQLHVFKHLLLEKDEHYRLYVFKYPESKSKYVFFVDKGQLNSNAKKSTVLYERISTYIECNVLPHQVVLTTFHVNCTEYSQCLVLLLHYWADIAENDASFPSILMHEYCREIEETPVNNYMKQIGDLKYNFIRRQRKDTYFTLKL